MKKNAMLSFTFMMVVLLFISGPVLADNDNDNDNNELDPAPGVSQDEYRYSGTVFWYEGQFLHEKDVRLPYMDGRTSFDLEGRGEVRGSQRIHSSSTYPALGECSHRASVETFLWGRTADDATALNLQAAEDEALEHARAQRQAEIDALNDFFKAEERMTAEEYQNRLDDIKEFYDELIGTIKMEYDEVKDNVKITSSVNVLVDNETSLLSGINMNPGETGYIKQNVYANRDQDGEYLRLNNEVSNTGGVTINDLEIDGYVNESLRVEGSAEVRQSARLDDGGARTGWWQGRP